MENTLPAQTMEALRSITTIVSNTGPLDEAILREITVAVTSPVTGFDDSWFEKLPGLKLIAVFGVGTDHISLQKARERHVDVATALNTLTDDVTDMAFALLLALTRQITQGDRLIREGQWAKGERLPLGLSLRNKRLGVVGLGAIGYDIARRAEAFGMKPRYYNRSPKPDAPWPCLPSITQLAHDSDILSVAISAAPQTEGIISRQVLEALGENGILVNIARGAVVDEAALIEALQQKTIRGAALDVFMNEPDINPAFFDLANVVLAPHQGSATIESRLTMWNCVVENIAAVLAEKPALTVVN